MGTGGLNSLALAFFDPTPMTSAPASCNFADTGNTCLLPAVNSGAKNLAFVQATVAATQVQLAANIPAGGGAPTYLLSFGGESVGGAAWDAMLSSASAAANFGTNAAALVAALSAAYPGAAFGIDLDIEGQATQLPQMAALVAAYRAGAPTALLQLCAYSGAALAGSVDAVKVAIMGAELTLSGTNG